jgi:hypothetical protein
MRLQELDIAGGVGKRIFPQQRLYEAGIDVRWL